MSVIFWKDNMLIYKEDVTGIMKSLFWTSGLKLKRLWGWRGVEGDKQLENESAQWRNNDSGCLSGSRGPAAAPLQLWSGKYIPRVPTPPDLFL